MSSPPKEDAVTVPKGGGEDAPAPVVVADDTTNTKAAGLFFFSKSGNAADGEGVVDMGNDPDAAPGTKDTEDEALEPTANLGEDGKVMVPNGTSVYFCLVMTNPFYYRQEEEERKRDAEEEEGDTSSTEMNEKGGADTNAVDKDPSSPPPPNLRSVVTDEDIHTYKPSARNAFCDEGLVSFDIAEEDSYAMERAVVETIWRLRLRGLKVEPEGILVKTPVPREDMPGRRGGGGGRGRGRGGGARGRGGDSAANRANGSAMAGDDDSTSPHPHNNNNKQWKPKRPLYVLTPEAAEQRQVKFQQQQQQRRQSGQLVMAHDGSGAGGGYNNTYASYDASVTLEGDLTSRSVDASSAFFGSNFFFGESGVTNATANDDKEKHLSREEKEKRRRRTQAHMRLREYGHQYFHLNKDAVFTSRPGRPDGKKLYIKITADRGVLLKYADVSEIMLRTHPLSDAGGAAWEYEDQYDADFARSVRSNKALMAKERREKERYAPLLKQINAETRREDAYKLGTDTRDPIGDMTGVDGYIFRVPEKLRTLEMIIRDPFAFGGCGLQVKEMVSQGNSYVEAFFPLHDRKELGRHGLIAWASLKNFFQFALSYILPQAERFVIYRKLNNNNSAKTAQTNRNAPDADDVAADGERGGDAASSLENDDTPLLWHRTYKETQQEAILSYFGEEVALYFLWIHELIAFLPSITFAGIVCAILPLITDEIPRSIPYFVFGVLSVVWGAAWVMRWNRIEAEFLFQYQQKELVAFEAVRDEYDPGNDGTPLNLLNVLRLSIDLPFIYRRSGQMEEERLRRNLERVEKLEAADERAAMKQLNKDIDALDDDDDGNDEDFADADVIDPIDVFVHFKDSKKNLRRFMQAIASILVLIIAAMYVAMTTALTYWRYQNIDSDLVSYASSIIGAAGAAVIGVVFDMVVTKTNAFENYPTDKALQKATITKNFFYNFFTFYYSMFIIALYPVDNVTGKDRLNQLETQMIIICVAKPWLQNAIEIITPTMKRLWNIVDCCGDKSEEGEEAVSVASEVEPTIASTGEVADRESLLQQYKEKQRRIAVAADLRAQANYPPYQPVTADYMEIVLQFGFMIMFASTFPWAPLCALFYNIIEIKVDATRHVYFMQRPVPQPTAGIGQWLLIKGLLVGLALITNAFFICILSDAPDALQIDVTDGNNWDWKSFIALQYLMAVCITVLAYFYGAKSKELMRMETKIQFLARRLRFKAAAVKAAKAKEAAIAATFAAVTAPPPPAAAAAAISDSRSPSKANPDFNNNVSTRGSSVATNHTGGGDTVECRGCKGMFRGGVWGLRIHQFKDKCVPPPPSPKTSAAKGADDEDDEDGVTGCPACGKLFVGRVGVLTHIAKTPACEETLVQ